MCVIISCKPNRRPSTEVVEASFARNPDGAGIMWADGTTVHGIKGLMGVESLLDAIEAAPAGCPLVIHCRIGTSGGYSPAVTHPYPVSGSLERLHELEWTAPVGIAHNGVLPYPTDAARDVSDTVSFIKREAYPCKRAHGLKLAASKAARRELARHSEGSRLAVMDASGRVALIGDGWERVCDGVAASNGSWRPLPELYGLPTYCAGCPDVNHCAHGCPLCEGVAASLGYTHEDVANEVVAYDGGEWY